MVYYLGQERWAAPWGRGQLGGWDAFLDHLQYFGYLLPVLTVVIGVILASAFSAILVYAQELVPGKVGLIAGLFFGLAFGMAGIGSAILGELADRTSIEYVFHICSFLPLIGLLTAFLPNVRKV